MTKKLLEVITHFIWTIFDLELVIDAADGFCYNGRIFTNRTG